MAMMQSLLRQQQAFFLEQLEAQRKKMAELLNRQRGDSNLHKGARGAHKKAGRERSESEASETYTAKASTERRH